LIRAESKEGGEGMNECFFERKIAPYDAGEKRGSGACESQRRKGKSASLNSFRNTI